jgi:hypothetical protein
MSIYEGGKRLAECAGRPGVPGATRSGSSAGLGFREAPCRRQPHAARSSPSTFLRRRRLNATPWAVWVDSARSETPIGSLSLPIGPHEFVFRHPEFGERRYAISLTAAEPLRLSVDMTRR